MYHNHSWAAKGHYGNRERRLHYLSAQRAAVNIYRTDTSYEIMVFAPGRIKEHFQLGIDGNELSVSYLPPDGFPRPEWVSKEYSRGGFVRSFTLDDTVDTAAIQAKYEDGVLQVSLPFIPGKERKQQVIPVV